MKKTGSLMLFVLRWRSLYRILAILGITLFIWGNTPTPVAFAAYSANLLQNPSFETGSLIPGWQKWGYPISVVRVQNCCASDGSWSAFVQPNGRYVELQQTLSVFQGNQYHLQAWVYTDGSTFQVSWYSDKIGSTLCGSTSSTAYVLIQCDLVVPPNTSIFNVHLGGSTATGWAVTDNWSLSLHTNLNAFRWMPQANQGAYANIVTGNPTLRIDPAASPVYSYMRVGVRSLNNNSFAEIGWLKSTDPNSNYVPKVYWTWQNISGYWWYYWGSAVTIGAGYNYQVKRSSTDYIGFYFNSIQTPVDIEYVGWGDTADNMDSGGEVTTANQGMGDSVNQYVTYGDPSTGLFYAACPTILSIDLSIYHVDNGAFCNAWHIYGNN